MRLHELSISAFGPFAETVLVDFDELSSGGVFLLTGDTGAGKTSVLDAVCFALYGEVPGDRHGARHLRCDQAEGSAQPRVALRFSIGERSFRFTRSPAWDRPKRRGSGTTRVQAHVIVEEARPDGWRALTNRLDEAGQLVTGLLGMSCSQFTQVAMLPQGRFQAFLRAPSSERHLVLQRLFRTRRYEEVERWLVDRRHELRRRCQTCHEQTADVLSRIQEAAGTDLPDGWEVHDLDPVVEQGALVPWVEELLGRSARDTETLIETVRMAGRRLDQDRSASERGRQLVECRARAERAQTSLVELDRTAGLANALAQSVERHSRAAAVLPCAARAETASRQAAESTGTAVLRREGVALLLGAPAEQVRLGTLAEAATRAAEQRAVAQTWLPRERELSAEDDRLTALRTRLVKLDQDIGASEDESTCLAGTRARLHPTLVETRTLAGQLGTRRAVLTAAETGLAAARQVVDLTRRLTEAEVLLLETTQLAQNLREVHLESRERRISGMAAELAGRLAAGCSCPVCGSATHPALAAATDRVSRTDEMAAAKRYEAAAFERQAVQESVGGVRVQLAGALCCSEELDVSQWERSRDTASAALEQSFRAAHCLGELDAELGRIEERDGELCSFLAGSNATREGVRLQLAEGDERCAKLAAEISALLDAHPGATSVAGLVELHTDMLRELTEAHEVVRRHEHDLHELAEATTAADTAARAAGFTSVAEAMGAVLPEGEAAAGTSHLADRRACRTAAERVLEERPVSVALTEPAPDLDALGRSLRASEDERDRAHAAHQQAASRALRLRALGARLRTEVDAWAPIRAEHALVAGLSSLTEGRSADNALKMRLSAYVLSERLRQVVAAANDRLSDMTDHRYRLEQADEKGAGEQRGGLSLRMRDDWSGKHRDPATLSGGETFVVALALALGLADTVSQEAGGTQLDTLFIDEGFGALDASTLDGVMDTLDSLRDGGRVVGLVSHVAELRNRIPSQLEVRKARSGSTLWVSMTDA